MWALYNDWDGQWWNGATWGPIELALTAPTETSAREQWLNAAERVPACDGQPIDRADIRPIEVEDCDCGHREERAMVGYRETLKATYLSPAEGTTACADCCERWEQARDAAAERGAR